MEKIWFVLLAGTWHATTDDPQTKKRVTTLCAEEFDAQRATDSPAVAQPLHDDCQSALDARNAARPE